MGSNPTQGMDVCVCVYSVFVLICVEVGALRRADPSSEESYRLCAWLRNWRTGHGPTKGCRAINERMKCVHVYYYFTTLTTINTITTTRVILLLSFLYFPFPVLFFFPFCNYKSGLYLNKFIPHLYLLLNRYFSIIFNSVRFVYCIIFPSAKCPFIPGPLLRINSSLRSHNSQHFSSMCLAPPTLPPVTFLSQILPWALLFSRSKLSAVVSTLSFLVQPSMEFPLQYFCFISHKIQKKSFHIDEGELVNRSQMRAKKL
jgi:hypothetical protein